MTVVGPVDGQVSPRYAGFSTFARLPRIEDVQDFQISVVGVPFDSAVTYRPGSRFAPAAIRESSRLLKSYNPAQKVYPFKSTQVVDAGDIEANPFSIEKALQEVETGLSPLVENDRRVVLLGGDQYFALPALRAIHKEHGPVALIHFDAHLDTWDTYFGEDYTHGSPFRRAVEEDLLAPNSSTHIGIRGSLYEENDLLEDANLGFKIVSSKEFTDQGVETSMFEAFKRAGDNPIYLSIDIDVIDPGLAPGTGTPEPGGILSREMLDAVRTFKGVNLVGADIVEVLPAYDHAGITALAAASLTYELVSIFSAQ